MVLQSLVSEKVPKSSPVFWTVKRLFVSCRTFNQAAECILSPQEYRTTALLGCETDSFDSQGAVVRVAPWKHITREKVEEALGTFRGEIMQTPPMHVDFESSVKLHVH